MCHLRCINALSVPLNHSQQTSQHRLCVVTVALFTVFWIRVYREFILCGFLELSTLVGFPGAKRRVQNYKLAL